MATETRDELALRLLGDVAELCRAAGATPMEMDKVYSPRSWPDISGEHRSYSVSRPDPKLLPGKVADCGIALYVLAHDLGMDLASAMAARVDERKKEVKE
jgi:hypothetical protein